MSGTGLQKGDNLRDPQSCSSHWNHSSHQEFFDYYAKESQSPKTLQRLSSVRDAVLRVAAEHDQQAIPLEVADIGCGAGTQCLLWAELGHRVHGLDVNEPLLQLAQARADSIGYSIDFKIGSASELPWPDASMDVCLALELLEHVEGWEKCLTESSRILRPGGILVVTTTNFLCPIQEEFRLPLYSWYPGRLKRYFESLARTSRPELANYATYPAVNWFSFYGLSTVLHKSGFQCLDRFDVLDVTKKSGLVRWIVYSVQRVPPLRWIAHVCMPGTLLLAIKGRVRAR